MLHLPGTKARLSKKIIKHFPKHRTYIEPFFGAGGMYFNKEEAQYNILNDIDAEIFNLFMVLRDNGKKFYEEWKNTPQDQNLFQYWKKNKEEDSIKRAIRFMFLSNYSIFSAKQTFQLRMSDNTKLITLKNIKECYLKINKAKISGMDFRRFFKSVTNQNRNSDKNVFVYNDPPYLGTYNEYCYGVSWGKKDLEDLITILIEKKFNFAISEFDGKVVNNFIRKYKLNKIIIGERRNIGNRQTEILMTNY